MSTTSPATAPCTDTSVAFLRKAYPEGPWCLAAIEPDGKPRVATFYPASEAECRKWIERLVDSHNLYFQVNPVKQPLDRKAKNEDIANVSYLFADVDGKAHTDTMPLAEQLQRIDQRIEAKLKVTPTCIVFTGGGRQLLLKIEPTTDFARAKACNEELAAMLDGDGVGDAARLGRLPGTRNLPNAKKRARGRTACLVGNAIWFDTSFTLDEFASKPATTKRQAIDVANVSRLANVDALDEWKVPGRVKVIVVQGYYPDEPKEGDDSRSAWLFDAVCNMLRAGVPDEVVYSVITDPQFGISQSVLEKKGQARRYALKQISSAKEHIEEPWLAKLNDLYFVVPVGGKTLVGNFEPVIVAFDKHGKPIMRDAISYRSLQAFQDLYENEKIEVGQTAKGAPIYMEIGKWWRKNNKRRQYEGVAFRPDTLDEIVDGKLNTFRGFACEASIGERHRHFKQFVFEVICNRDPIVFDYLWKWVANAVQYPGRIGEVAIGLRGLKGTGKTFFAAVIAHLFGQHGLVTGDGNLLVGKFNAPLEMLCLLVMDEAHVFTDQRSRGIVKTRVTGATIDIERKGVDVVTVPNCLHLMFISNDEQFLDASDDERRYLALTVSDEHKDDFAYFEGLQNELDAGGYGDLLGELRSLDLSGFNVRRVPKTDELRRQAGLASSGTPIAEQVAEVLDAIPFGCFKLGELCEFLGLEIKGSNDSQFRDVKKALISAGYEHGKRTPIGEHEQIRVWFKTGMPLARVRLFKKMVAGSYGNFDQTCFEWHRADYPAIDAALMEQFGPHFGPWLVSAHLGKAQGVAPTNEERSRLRAKALESLAEGAKGGEGA